MADFINPFPGVKPSKKLDDQELASSVRLAIAAEHEAVHLYESIAAATNNKKAKTLLLDIANEEKVHIGELGALLESFRKDEKDLLDEGFSEAKDKLSAWVRDNVRTS